MVSELHDLIEKSREANEDKHREKCKESMSLNISAAWKIGVLSRRMTELCVSTHDKLEECYRSIPIGVTTDGRNSD